MKLALTGATGFLGRSVLSACIHAGHSVRALIRPGRASPSEGAEVVHGTLGDPAAARELLAGADVLLHLAALGVQSRDRDWARMVEVNVAGSLALLEDAARAGVGRVVAAGTCLEYRGWGRLPDAPAGADGPSCDEDAPIEPADGYGASKAAGGLVLRARARELGVPCWYLRIASLYGPKDDAQKLVPGALAAARAGRQFEMSGGEQVREWLHVDDAVRAVLAAAGRDPRGALVVNVGTGAGHPLREVAKQVFRAAGADPGLVKAGARPYRRGEVHRLVMDVERARTALDWKAEIDLERGLAALAAAGRDGEVT